MWSQHGLAGYHTCPRIFLVLGDTSHLNSCPLRLKKILKFTSISSLFLKKYLYFFMIFVMVLSCSEVDDIIFLAVSET